jgi:hypothetical protein
MIHRRPLHWPPQTSRYRNSSTWTSQDGVRSAGRLCMHVLFGRCSRSWACHCLGCASEGQCYMYLLDEPKVAAASKNFELWAIQMKTRITYTHACVYAHVNLWTTRSRGARVCFLDWEIWVWFGAHKVYAHTHVYTHTKCMHIHMYTHIPDLRAAQKRTIICIYITCVSMHVRMCIHAKVCVTHWHIKELRTTHLLLQSSKLIASSFEFWVVENWEEEKSSES